MVQELVLLARLDALDGDPQWLVGRIVWAREQIRGASVDVQDRRDRHGAAHVLLASSQALPGQERGEPAWSGRRDLRRRLPRRGELPGCSGGDLTECAHGSS